MDPNTVFMVMAAGSVLGVIFGFLLSGEGYGWVFNAAGGGVGALFGIHILAGSAVDLGPTLNGLMLAMVFTSATAMVLRS